MKERVRGKGINFMEECQKELEWRIVSGMKCLGCGMPIYQHDPEILEVGLELLFDMPFCSQGCAADYHGYQGSSIL